MKCYLFSKLSAVIKFLLVEASLKLCFNHGLQRWCHLPFLLSSISLNLTNELNFQLGKHLNKKITSARFGEYQGCCTFTIQSFTKNCFVFMPLEKACLPHAQFLLLKWIFYSRKLQETKGVWWVWRILWRNICRNCIHMNDNSQGNRWNLWTLQFIIYFLNLMILMSII